MLLALVLVIPFVAQPVVTAVPVAGLKEVVVSLVIHHRMELTVPPLRLTCTLDGLKVVGPGETPVGEQDPKNVPDGQLYPPTRAEPGGPDAEAGCGVQPVIVGCADATAGTTDINPMAAARPHTSRPTHQR